MSDLIGPGTAKPVLAEPPVTLEVLATDDPTPIFVSLRSRNLLILAVAAAIVLLYWAVPTILTISLGGGFLALILSFPVRLLSKVLPRGLAIFVTLLILVALLCLAVLILVPALISQLSGLIAAIPTLASDGERLLRDVIRPLKERGWISRDTDDVIADLRNGVTARASQLAQDILTNLSSAVSSIFDVAVTTFGVVFVAIYLLIDIRRMKAAYLRVAPKAYRRDALLLWDQSGSSLSRYLGGLSVSLLAQGVLSGLALWAIGVPYPVLLGLWVSITAVIPFLGAFAGAIPAVLLGFAESPTTGILTILLYIAIQQLESNILTPRIQGRAVRVHPILVLLTVIAANELDGLRGAVFAVPTLAVLRVLFDFLVARIRVRP